MHTHALRHLKAADPVLKRVINAVGPCTLKPRGSRASFHTLAQAIVGQQISVKAADSIWKRLMAQCGGGAILRPARVLRCSTVQLRRCGLSRAKAAYLRALAQHFNDRRVDTRALARQSDEAVVAELTRLHGIGRWTAEMYLMFTLGRPDVLPTGDLGFMRAVQKIYGFKTQPAARTVERLARCWRPYRSVATWYLWAVVDDGAADAW